MKSPQGTEMLDNLRSLLTCNFHNLTKYLAHEKEYSVGFPRSSKLWRWCKMNPPSPSCWSPSFLSPFCEIFPSLTIKIMRLQVESAKHLLQEGLVDKVLLLVRDPRGTMASRGRVSWCTNPDCKDAARHCRDMEHAFTQYVDIKRAFSGGQIRTLRYEDLIRDPHFEARKMFTWAGIEWTENTEKYILTHTTR